MLHLVICFYSDFVKGIFMAFRLWLLLLLIPHLAFAHSGKTDNQGCHKDQKSGEVHCHKKGESRGPTLEDSERARRDILRRDELKRVVKKTIRHECVGPKSKWYKKITLNYTGYPDMRACLAAGGIEVK